MLRLLAMSLMIGCGASRGAPPPPVPTSTRTPLDASVPSRLAVGSPDGPRVTIPLDLAALDQVGTARWDDVATHLAADPRWRLVERDGAVVAFERARDAHGWWAPREGYRDEDGHTVRAALRFLSWERDVDWERSPAVTRASAGDASATLALWPTATGHASALDVRGADLSLDVFEDAPSEARPYTTTTIADVGALVSTILADTRIQVRGYARDALPDEEPTRRHAMRITSPAPLQLEIRARLNPGAPGWTWLRIVDARGVPWAEEAVAVGSREAVGWSSDPAETLWMQGRFPAPGGPAFRGHAELWFVAADQEPVRLQRRALRIPAR